MERNSRPFAISIVLALALLFSYPLSIGPAYWLCSDDQGKLRDSAGQTTFLSVYSPLLCDYPTGVPGVRTYLRMWGAP